MENSDRKMSNLSHSNLITTTTSNKNKQTSIPISSSNLISSSLNSGRGGMQDNLSSSQIVLQKEQIYDSRQSAKNQAKLFQFQEDCKKTSNFLEFNSENTLSLFSSGGFQSVHGYHHGESQDYPFQNLKQYQNFQIMQTLNNGLTEYDTRMPGTSALSSQQSSQSTNQGKNNLFFESPSKYISLKKYRQDNEYFIRSQCEELIDLQKKSQIELSVMQSAALGSSQKSNSNVTSQISGGQSNVRSAPRDSFLAGVDVKAQHDEVFGRQVPSKNVQIKAWFEQLCLADKALSLTVVDKQLVNLILEMYQLYCAYRHGKFTNNYPTSESQNSYGYSNRNQTDIDSYMKLKHFKVLFKKPHYQSENQYSRYLRDQNEAEDILIGSIRLLNLSKSQKDTQSKSSTSNQEGSSQSSKNVKDNKQIRKIKLDEARKLKEKQLTQFDALTIELGQYSNLNFFFEMMKKINNNNLGFLSQELQLSNDKEKLDGSVFYQTSSSNHNNDPTAQYEQKEDPNIQEKPKVFFTFLPSQKTTFIKDSPQEFTLAQVLYLIFEKALNVQYHDHIQKLNQKQQVFFFTEPIFNIFNYDLQLTHYWLKLDVAKRNGLITQLNEIDREITSQEHLKKYNQQIRKGSDSDGEEFASKIGDEESHGNYGTLNKHGKISPSQCLKSSKTTIHSKKYTSDIFNEEDEDRYNSSDEDSDSQRIVSKYLNKSDDSDKSQQDSESELYIHDLELQIPLVRKKVVERNQNDYALGQKQAAQYQLKQQQISTFGKKAGKDSDDSSKPPHVQALDNPLMNQNQLKLKVTQILTQSRNTKTILNTFNFIKSLSTHACLLNHKSDDLGNILKERFYQLLIDSFNSFNYEELMMMEQEMKLSVNQSKSGSNTGTNNQIKSGQNDKIKETNSGNVNQNAKGQKQSQVDKQKLPVVDSSKQKAQSQNQPTEAKQQNQDTYPAQQDQTTAVLPITAAAKKNKKKKNKNKNKQQNTQQPNEQTAPITSTTEESKLVEKQDYDRDQEDYKKTYDELQNDLRSIQLVKQLYQHENKEDRTLAQSSSFIDSVFLAQEVLQIQQHQRKIDERRSLITEEYLQYKYPEDNIAASSIYQPPNLPSSDANNDKITEIKSSIEKDKSKSQIDSQNYKSAESSGNLKTTTDVNNNNDAEQAQTQTKKKKRKNKNKKKNKNKQQQQQEPVPDIVQLTSQDQQDKTADTLQDSKIETENTPSQNLYKMIKSNLEHINVTIQEEDGIESINLDQIELSLQDDKEEQQKSMNFYSNQGIEQLPSEMHKKQNNFIDPSDEIDSTPVVVIKNNQSLLEDDKTEEEEETKSLTLDISVGICNQVIFAANDEGLNNSTVQKNNTNLKQQNKQKAIEEVKQTKQGNNLKKNKKGQQKNQQQIQQATQQQSKSKASQKQKNQQESLQKQQQQVKLNTPKIELASPQQLQRERFDNLYQEGMTLHQMINSASPRSKSTMKKKHVEFKGIPLRGGETYDPNSQENDQNDDELIRIPKRGSSRGSSVGTEDVVHQHTLNSLGDLFPQEYKNPSDDTKIKIIEITTSSDGGNSLNGSPNKSLIQSKSVAVVQISNQNQKIIQPPQHQDQHHTGYGSQQKIYARKQTQSNQTQQHSEISNNTRWNQQTDNLTNQNQRKKQQTNQQQTYQSQQQQQQQLIYQAKDSQQNRNLQSQQAQINAQYQQKEQKNQQRANVISQQKAQEFQTQNDQLIQQQTSKQTHEDQTEAVKVDQTLPIIQKEQEKVSLLQNVSQTRQADQKKPKEEPEKMIQQISPQSNNHKAQSKTNKKERQAKLNQQRYQLNFDSYEAMFQTAYNSTTHPQTNMQNYYVQKMDSSNLSRKDSLRSKSQNQQEEIKVNIHVNQQFVQDQEYVKDSMNELHQQKLQEEVIEQKPDDQLQQNVEKIKQEEVNLSNQDAPQSLNQVNLSAGQQIEAPQEQQILINQPFINLKKSKKQIRQENRELREQGASVNPDILHNLQRKQQQLALNQLLTPQIQQSQNISNFVVPGTSNTQKKVKPKAMKPNNTKFPTQAQQLSMAPFEQRSQTPIIEQQSESLFVKNSSQQLNVKKNLQYQNPNLQQKGQQQQQAHGKSNANKKKISQAQMSQQQAFNHSMNFPHQNLEQLIQFDQQQQQFVNQNFLRLQQQQMQMNLNQNFLNLQPPLIMSPNLNQQMLFNTMYNQTQPPFLISPQPLIQTPISPTGFNQLPQQNPLNLQPMTQQQFVFSKLSNTQETQTDSQNNQAQHEVNQQVSQDDQHQLKEISGQPQPIDISSQTSHLSQQQQQNFQSMINQISNINIQVYQMPFQNQQPLNMFNSLGQGHLADPYGMSLQSQLNPYLFQNQALLNTQLNGLYSQNPLFMPNFNNQLLIPPSSFSPNSSLNSQLQQQNFGASQFNQPFTTFQQQQQQQNMSGLGQQRTHNFNSVPQSNSPILPQNYHSNEQTQQQQNAHHKYSSQQQHSHSQQFTNPHQLSTNMNFQNANFIPQHHSSNNSSMNMKSFDQMSMSSQSAAMNQNQSQYYPVMNTERQVTHQTLDQYKAQTREELFFQKFDREIYKLMIEQQVKLQKTEYERQLAFKYIEQFVKQAYQEFVNVKVQMYGSMATGLAIDSSDMDVLVSGVFNQEGLIDRPQLIEQMRRLHKYLNELYCLESNSLIETATVPVIKIILDLQKIRDQNQEQTSSNIIEEDMKHLKIDITFNEQEGENNYITGFGFAQPIHMGIKCCHFIKQKLHEYPQLQSLTLLLKKFLALRDLNSPFTGGLSSYGLILLIIAFINQDLPQTYDPVTEQLSPARIFAQFLFYYGRIFDVKLSMINEYQHIVPPNILTFQSILIIIDPLNLQNNIGKSTYNFDQIRDEFARAYDKIINLYNTFIDGNPKRNKSSSPVDGSSGCNSIVDEKNFEILRHLLYLEDLEEMESNINDQQEQIDQIESYSKIQTQINITTNINQ